MTNIEWRLVGIAARLLERDEREAVLGDLVETGDDAGRGLFDILDLVVRRQILLWKSWRPWLAAFGLALPGSLLLMGTSVCLSLTYQRLLGPRILDVIPLTQQEELLPWLSQLLLLIGCSWASGFAVGSMSRRTLWVSIVSSCVPCLFCLTSFREESLSRLCLFLFLAPAIWGVRQGVRVIRIKLGPSIILAVSVTVLMLPTWTSPRLYNLALIWPAWYLVATARRSGRGRTTLRSQIGEESTAR
jgi:hypothetical protein